MSAETLALWDAIDDVIFLQHMISELLLNNSVKILIVYTDNQSLFDKFQSTNNVTKKRLRTDIVVGKENIENDNVYIYWVNTNQQLDNVLTKQRVCYWGDLSLETIHSCVLPVVNYLINIYRV